MKINLEREVEGEVERPVGFSPEGFLPPRRLERARTLVNIDDYDTPRFQHYGLKRK
jgi:hypothetical protein